MIYGLHVYYVLSAFLISLFSLLAIPIQPRPYDSSLAVRLGITGKLKYECRSIVLYFLSPTVTLLNYITGQSALEIRVFKDIEGYIQLK